MDVHRYIGLYVHSCFSQDSGRLKAKLIKEPGINAMIPLGCTVLHKPLAAP